MRAKIKICLNFFSYTAVDILKFSNKHQKVRGGFCERFEKLKVCLNFIQMEVWFGISIFLRHYLKTVFEKRAV